MLLEGSVILDFLNSDFGLWLLSAFFITGFGAVFRHWQKNRDEQKALTLKNESEQKIVDEKRKEAERENQDMISKLDVEIGHRLSTVLLKLASIESLVDAQYANESNDMRLLTNASLTLKTLQSLNERDPAINGGLYPEYSTYTFTTLLAELRRRLPEASRGLIEASTASYTSMLIKMTYPPGSPPSRQAGEILLKKVILKRWHETASNYMECIDESKS